VETEMSSNEILRCSRSRFKRAPNDSTECLLTLIAAALKRSRAGF
jgi:hypothetical protein